MSSMMFQSRNVQSVQHAAQNGELGVARSRRVGSYVFCEHFPEEILRGALGYQHRPGEVYIVTYPKCGTTWMQHIMYNIYSRGEPPPTVGHFFHNMPFLERHGVEALEGLTCPPGAIKTHMLYDEKRICPEAKYVYVMRNPFDCCVSFYHHYKMYPIYGFENGTFEDFLQLFLEGDVDGGDYFDHLLSWYPHRNDSNVLCLRYEDLKADTESWVLAVADFLGPQHGKALRSDPDVMAKVLRAISVEAVRKLSRLEREYQAKFMEETPKNLLPRWAQLYLNHSGSSATAKPEKGASAVRKGEVGDWRNHFSEEQAQKMKKKAEEMFKGLNLLTLWKDCLDV
ncbi:sulfotransferase ssu-1-like [Haemaphysalis longicornis]